MFTSPRRLNLRLLCIARRPVRQMLDIWPTLPIVISDLADAASLEEGADNISAALEHHDRVRRISLWSVPSFLFERFTAAMLKPFPELTSLALRSSDESPSVLPNAFLGRSAPQLRSMYLNEHRISGIEWLTFVSRQPRPSARLGQSTFLLRFARSDGPLHSRNDEARIALPWIPFPSTSITQIRSTSSADTHQPLRPFQV